MFRVVRYRDYGFTSSVVFCSFNKWAAISVFAKCGDDVDFEQGYLLMDENGNKYNVYGFITEEWRH